MLPEPHQILQKYAVWWILYSVQSSRRKNKIIYAQDDHNFHKIMQVNFDIFKKKKNLIYEIALDKISKDAIYLLSTLKNFKYKIK